MKEGKSERPKGSDKSEGYCVLNLIQLCEPVLTDKVSGDSRNRDSVVKSLTCKDIENLQGILWLETVGLEHYL